MLNSSSSSFSEVAVNKKIESVEKSVNRYLLEYIANGFAVYGKSTKDFVDNVDKWIKNYDVVKEQFRMDKNVG